MEDNLNFGDNLTPQSIVINHYSSKPTYLIGYWNDSDDNDNPCASVAILTFSVIDKLSDFFINTVTERLLEYKYVLPASLTVSNRLHAVWIAGKGEKKKLAQYHGIVNF